MSRRSIHALLVIIILNLLILPISIQLNKQQNQTNPLKISGDLMIQSNAPVVLWNKTWDNPSTDVGNGIAVDSNGSLYYVGSTGNYLALSKFFPNGTIAWQNTNSTVGLGRAVAVDAAGGIYCVGRTNNRMLVVKLFPNGTKAWEFLGEYNRFVDPPLGGMGMAIDSMGYIYCIGACINGMDEPFLLKYKFSSNGTKIWGVWDFSLGQDIAVDNAGFIYYISINHHLYGYSSQLIKEDQDGHWVWGRYCDSFFASAITIDHNCPSDPDGSIYCLGTTDPVSGHSDLMLIKFSSNGMQLWNTTWGGSGYDYGYGVAVDARGSVYCVGTTKGTGTSTNLALIKFLPNGTQAWQTIWGGSHETYGYGVAVDTNGSIYCAGCIDSDFLLLKVTELLNTIPSAPLNLQGTAVDGSILLTWEAPSSNGGSDITNYKIYRGNASGTETYLITIGTSLNYTDSSVILEQTYYYTVSAVNGVGEGPLSDEMGVLNHRAPGIFASSVTPDAGDQYTLFNFSLIYKQVDNRSPSFVNVLLNETPFRMNKYDHMADNYSNGVLYEYITCLTPGIYIYSFECNDGICYNFTGTKILVVTPSTNATAQVVWANIWGGPTIQSIRQGAIAVDSNGSIYCVGQSGNYLTLVKFYANGTMAWQNDNSIKGYGCGLAVDINGCIYCVGQILPKVLLVKFFPNGTKAWEYVRHLGFVGISEGVAVDNRGSIYCVGYYYDFDTHSFLSKVSSNGTLIWEKTFTYGIASALAVDDNGSIYVGALSSRTLFKFSPDGTKIWERQIPSIFLHGITIDSNRSIYGVGAFNIQDLGLVKFLSNGTKIWQTTWGNSSITEDGEGVAVDSKGFIYCVAFTGGKGNLAVIKFFSNGTKVWQIIFGGSHKDVYLGTSHSSVVVHNGSIYCGSCIDHKFLLLKMIEISPTLTPTIIVSHPLNNLYLRGGQIWINGTASAGANHMFQNILINDTRFTNATNLIGANAGNFGFYNNSPLPDGLLRINITCINNAGQKSSEIVLFTIDNTPPSSVIITIPSIGACVKGTIWINATATDSIGIQNVTFYQDAAVLIGTDMAAPYAIRWNTTMVANGNHTLYVRAFDNAGNYRDSVNTLVRINNTSPSPPLNLQATPGNWHVNLTWQAPTDNGGSIITHYQIYRGYSPNNEIFFKIIDTTTHIDTQVSIGQTYYYKVSAVNAIGEGLPSGEVNATPRTAPSAPQHLQAAAGNYSVTLTWEPPSYNGGYVVTHYIIYRANASGPETYLTTIGNVLNYTDTDFTIGPVYYYQVSAVNDLGEGLPSAEVNATPGTIPSAPQHLQAAAGNCSVTLTWEPPSYNGGFVITHYTIQRGTSSGGETYLTTVDNLLMYCDTGLTNGQRYYYKVSALNDLGEGNLSLEVEAKPATVPHAPHTLSVLVTNGKIVIVWHAPPDNGGASISGYKIYRGTVSNNETYFLTIGNVTSFTDTQFVNGQTYYYRISSVNAMGESSWSAEVVAMVYISEKGNWTFNLIIIFLFGAVALGFSGYIIYSNRKIKRLKRKITELLTARLYKAATKLGKLSSIESLEQEYPIKQQPLSDEWDNILCTIEKEFALAIRNGERIDEPNIQEESSD